MRTLQDMLAWSPDDDNDNKPAATTTTTETAAAQTQTQTAEGADKAGTDNSASAVTAPAAGDYTITAPPASQPVDYLSIVKGFNEDFDPRETNAFTRLFEATVKKPQQPDPKKVRNAQIAASIGNGLASLAEMYGLSKGAYPAPRNPVTVDANVKALYDRYKADSEKYDLAKLNAQWKDYAQGISNRAARRKAINDTMALAQKADKAAFDRWKAAADTGIRAQNAQTNAVRAAIYGAKTNNSGSGSGYATRLNEENRKIASLAESDAVFIQKMTDEARAMIASGDNTPLVNELYEEVFIKNAMGNTERHLRLTKDYHRIANAYRKYKGPQWDWREDFSAAAGVTNTERAASAAGSSAAATNTESGSGAAGNTESGGSDKWGDFKE